MDVEKMLKESLAKIPNGFDTDLRARVNSRIVVRSKSNLKTKFINGQKIYISLGVVASLLIVSPTVALLLHSKTHDSQPVVNTAASVVPNYVVSTYWRLTITPMRDNHYSLQFTYLGPTPANNFTVSIQNSLSVGTNDGTEVTKSPSNIMGFPDFYFPPSSTNVVFNLKWTVNGKLYKDTLTLQRTFG